MVTRATAVHEKVQLLDVLLGAIRDSGSQCIVVDEHHPFGIQILSPDGFVLPARFYIWNCTHGGGSKRARDEFRIQFTPAAQVPKLHVGEVVVLLGWHDGYEVFVGWSIAHHANQKGKSPSAQVKEATLAAAHTNAFSIQIKTNGQIVVAFKPQFLVDYVQEADQLHGYKHAKTDLQPLNDLAKVNDSDVEAIGDQERKRIVTRILRKYRAFDFRARVLSAYKNRCAFCGVQLELLDAAHILPVADGRSRDSTFNGIALCKMHHAAFDRVLISFNDKYKIETSQHEIQRLAAAGRDGGLGQFNSMLRPMIELPVDARDYPPPALINTARASRGWKP
ncbi:MULTISPECIES: HNH endonuclease [unclassified Rhizobacter]|uniref:HNH endonuclease n=1 Tax=unclassified Rhizobacter TaxID=2640088 RepID=UPI0009E70850|nr:MULTISPECIES: HNH endonuclease [unclassified Rhizobacter]